MQTLAGASPSLISHAVAAEKAEFAREVITADLAHFRKQVAMFVAESQLELLMGCLGPQPIPPILARRTK